ncbi:protein tyrosine phosphatase type IVA 2-like [Rhagoletis pomonella]|uniref:protein tyrosine phosphatase type IVA 2-like n=1 Tax=Rhagoletis pomonella TaxID=28610 RepID=UPI00177E2489|nr:protein tyrosine phosphatase type IVA 2-like [Rhagoletis pomonella]
MRFLITDTPNKFTIKPFIENLLRHNVKLLVGLCDVSYDTGPFVAANIEVLSLQFPERTLPDEQLKRHWFRILLRQQSEYPDSCVAVHGNSGLGRAALLVAIALIELGMGYDIAVAVIRSKRRGAINDAQFEYLKNYKPETRNGLTQMRQRKASNHCVVQ